MKKYLVAFSLCFFVLVDSASAQQAAPGSLLVKFKKQTDIRVDSELSFTIPLINQKVTLREEGVILGGKKDMALESATNLTPNISNDSPIVSIDVKEDSKLQETINKYKNDPNVEFAEPDYVVSSLTTPNDPYFQGGIQGYQWNLERINVRQAWDLAANGSTNIKVAIIDSGVNLSVPEFSGTNFLNPKSFQSIYFDSANSCSAFGSTTQVISSDVTDDVGHGTHVAATVAQKTNNGSHSAGIASGITLIPVKVLFRCLSGTFVSANGLTSDIVAGINYAVAQGAKVINLSLGGSGYSQSQKDAINTAVNSGVTVVAASGNSATRTSSPAIIYPAGFPDTISVGATKWDNQRAVYSQYTPVDSRGIDLVAPGGQTVDDDQTQILDQNNDEIPDGIVQQTIDPSNPTQPTSVADFGGGGLCVDSTGYYNFEKCGLYQGTSMAAPHVTGVIALMLSVNPNLTPSQIKDILKNTTQRTVVPNYNSLEYGAGLLDAFAAVSNASSLNPSPTPTLTPTPTTPITITNTPTPTTPAATATPTATPTPVPLPGDLNNDNKVDMLDYNLFIPLFGNNGGPADFDSNNKVDIFDYAIFVSNFGKTI